MTPRIFKETIGDILRDLSEVFSAKPPTDRAVDLWVSTFSNIDPQETINALYDWPKFHNKMPTPADIRKSVGDRIAYRIEEQARLNREEAENIEPIEKRVDPETLQALRKWRKARARARQCIPQNFWVLNAVSRFNSLSPFNKNLTVKAYGRTPTDADIEKAKFSVACIEQQYDQICPSLGQFIRIEKVKRQSGPSSGRWTNPDRNHDDAECPF